MQIFYIAAVLATGYYRVAPILSLYARATGEKQYMSILHKTTLPYMKPMHCILATIILFNVACNKEDENKPAPYIAIDPLTDLQAGSFLPMHIGNFWMLGTNSYIKITDTARINNKLYYQFSCLTGGDAFSTKYLRIDENNQLWESYPSQPGKEYLHAKFNAGQNEVFYTLNDQSWNDYKVVMSGKTDSTREFSFDMVYHPNMKGGISIRKYRRGYGWCDDTWDSVRINGVVFKR